MWRTFFAAMTALTLIGTVSIWAQQCPAPGPGDERHELTPEDRRAFLDQPRLEERIFLFIDTVGSTGMAGRLGELTFLRLLNRFVADLTAPIVAARGDFHRYVGDELIADGVVEARCVRACFGTIDGLDYPRQYPFAGNAQTLR